MWTTREHEQLAVFADELQQRGDPWGELIATSMALASASEPAQAEALTQRLAELQRTVFVPRLESWLPRHYGHIRPIWNLGVLVGIRVTRTLAAPPDTFERTASLLRLPIARFLWFVECAPWQASGGIRDETATMLLAPEVVARPRVVILGGGPQVGLDRDSARAVSRLASIDRGVTRLVVNGAPRELSWARGGKDTREEAIHQLRARVRARRLSGEDQTALGRALADRSARVQIAALDCIAELGPDAAVFVSDILQMSGNRQPTARRDDLLRELATRPELVERVRDNFIPEQIHVLRWLERVATFDERSLDRVVAMLTQPYSADPPYVSELIELVRRYRPDFQRVHWRASPPSSRQPSLFERTLGWLRKR